MVVAIIASAGIANLVASPAASNPTAAHASHYKISTCRTTAAIAGLALARSFTLAITLLDAAHDVGNACWCGS